jgi:hypothetical protein
MMKPARKMSESASFSDTRSPLEPPDPIHHLQPPTAAPQKDCHNKENEIK